MQAGPIAVNHSVDGFARDDAPTGHDPVISDDLLGIFHVLYRSKNLQRILYELSVKHDGGDATAFVLK